MTKLLRARRCEYTRPCDECSRRRVKCDLSTSENQICSNCKHYGRSCTDQRVKLRSGPKPSKSLFQASRLGKIPFDELKLCINLYQSFLYRFWPFLSSSQLIADISSTLYKEGNKTSVVLDRSNAMSYVICCVLGASVVELRYFDTDIYQFSNKPVEFYAEGKRVLYEYELDMNPSVELIEYNFLSHSYLNSKGLYINKSILCLREAISTAKLLGLHLPKTYLDKKKEERHMMRKLYYLLLIVERFQCFRYQCYQINVDLLLEATIKFPQAEYDDYPELLVGFVELIKVFTSVDRSVFQELNEMANDHHKDSEEDEDLWNKFKQMTEQLTTDKLQRIISFQSKLASLEPSILGLEDEAQRFNVILSKSWLQSLGWIKTCENHSLTQKVDYLSTYFPLKIAKDFLISSSKMSYDAYARNGPGICLKMLQIVDSLNTLMKNEIGSDDWQPLGRDLLLSLVKKIEYFRYDDYKIPQKVLVSVKALENSRSCITIAPTLLIADPSYLNANEHQESEQIISDSSIVSVNNLIF